MTAFDYLSGTTHSTALQLTNIKLLPALNGVLTSNKLAPIQDCHDLSVKVMIALLLELVIYIIVVPPKPTLKT